MKSFTACIIKELYGQTLARWASFNAWEGIFALLNHAISKISHHKRQVLETSKTDTLDSSNLRYDRIKANKVIEKTKDLESGLIETPKLISTLKNATLLSTVREGTLIRKKTKHYKLEILVDKKMKEINKENYLKLLIQCPKALKEPETIELLQILKLSNMKKTTRKILEETIFPLQTIAIQDQQYNTLEEMAESIKEEKENYDREVEQLAEAEKALQEEVKGSEKGKLIDRMGHRKGNAFVKLQDFIANQKSNIEATKMQLQIHMEELNDIISQQKARIEKPIEILNEEQIKQLKKTKKKLTQINKKIKGIQKNMGIKKASIKDLDEEITEKRTLLPENPLQELNKEQLQIQEKIVELERERNKKILLKMETKEKFLEGTDAVLQMGDKFLSLLDWKDELHQRKTERQETLALQKSASLQEIRKETNHAHREMVLEALGSNPFGQLLNKMENVDQRPIASKKQEKKSELGEKKPKPVLEEIQKHSKAIKNRLVREYIHDIQKNLKEFPKDLSKMEGEQISNFIKTQIDSINSEEIKDIVIEKAKGEFPKEWMNAMQEIWWEREGKVLEDLEKRQSSFDNWLEKNTGLKQNDLMQAGCKTTLNKETLGAPEINLEEKEKASNIIKKEIRKHLRKKPPPEKKGEDSPPLSFLSETSIPILGEKEEEQEIKRFEGIHKSFEGLNLKGLEQQGATSFFAKNPPPSFEKSGDIDIFQEEGLAYLEKLQSNKSIDYCEQRALSFFSNYCKTIFENPTTPPAPVNSRIIQEALESVLSHFCEEGKGLEDSCQQLFSTMENQTRSELLQNLLQLQCAGRNEEGEIPVNTSLLRMIKQWKRLVIPLEQKLEAIINRMTESKEEGFPARENMEMIKTALHASPISLEGTEAAPLQDAFHAYSKSGDKPLGMLHKELSPLRLRSVDHDLIAHQLTLHYPLDKERLSEALDSPEKRELFQRTIKEGYQRSSPEGKEKIEKHLKDCIKFAFPPPENDIVTPLNIFLQDIAYDIEIAPTPPKEHTQNLIHHSDGTMRILGCSREIKELAIQYKRTEEKQEKNALLMQIVCSRLDLESLLMETSEENKQNLKKNISFMREMDSAFQSTRSLQSDIKEFAKNITPEDSQALLETLEKYHNSNRVDGNRLPTKDVSLTSHTAEGFVSLPKGLEWDLTSGAIYSHGMRKATLPEHIRKHEQISSLQLDQLSYYKVGNCFVHRPPGEEEDPSVILQEREGELCITRQMSTINAEKKLMQFASKEEQEQSNLSGEIASRLGICQFWVDEEKNIHGFDAQNKPIALLKKGKNDAWDLSFEGKKYSLLSPENQEDDLLKELSKAIPQEEILALSEGEGYWVPGLNLQVKKENNEWICSGESFQNLLLEMEKNENPHLVFKQRLSEEEKGKQIELQRNIADLDQEIQELTIEKDEQKILREEIQERKDKILELKEGITRETLEKDKKNISLLQKEIKGFQEQIQSKGTELPINERIKSLQEEKNSIRKQFHQLQGKRILATNNEEREKLRKAKQEFLQKSETAKNSYDDYNKAKENKKSYLEQYENAKTNKKNAQKTLQAHENEPLNSFLYLQDDENALKPESLSDILYISRSGEESACLNAIDRSCFDQALNEKELKLLQEAKNRKDLSPDMKLFLNFLHLRHCQHLRHQYARGIEANDPREILAELKKECKESISKPPHTWHNTVEILWQSIKGEFENADEMHPSKQVKETDPKAPFRFHSLIADVKKLPIESLGVSIDVPYSVKEIALEASQKALVERLQRIEGEEREEIQSEIDGFYWENYGAFNEKTLLDAFRVGVAEENTGLAGIGRGEVQELFQFMEGEGWIKNQGQSESGPWQIKDNPLDKFSSNTLQAYFEERGFQEKQITPLSLRLQQFLQQASANGGKFSLPEDTSVLEESIANKKNEEEQHCLEAQDKINSLLEGTPYTLTDVKTAYLTNDFRALSLKTPEELHALRNSMTRYLFHQTETHHLKDIENCLKNKEQAKEASKAAQLLYAPRSYNLDVLLEDPSPENETEQKIQRAFLLFEEDFGHRCSPRQGEIFRGLLLDDKIDPDAIDAAQARMGFGKTTLLPLIALAKADGETLVRFIVPASARETNTSDLSQSLERLLGKRAIMDDFKRYHIPTFVEDEWGKEDTPQKQALESIKNDLQQRLNLYQTAKEEKLVLVQSPNVRNGLEDQLKIFYDLLPNLAPESLNKSLLLECIHVLHSIRSLPSYNVFDELDATQDLNSTDVNYTTGEKLPIDSDEILPLETIIHTIQEHPKMDENSLADILLEKLSFAKEEVKSFVTSTDIPCPEQLMKESVDLKQNIKNKAAFLIRACLTDKKMFSLVKDKTPNTDFGPWFAPDASGKRSYDYLSTNPEMVPPLRSPLLIAIPYSAANTPKPRGSQFDNPEVTALATLRYYEDNTTLVEEEPHLTFLLEALEEREKIRAFFTGEDGERLLNDLEQLNSIEDNVVLQEKKTLLFHQIESDPHRLASFKRILGRCIVAKQVQYDDGKANSNRYERSNEKERSIGFSGTGNKSASYAFDRNRLDPAADGNMTLGIMGRENCQATFTLKQNDELISAEKYTHDMLNELFSKEEKNTRTIIDVGGLCKISNKKVAEHLLKKAEENGLQGVIFFDDYSNTKKVLLLDDSLIDYTSEHKAASNKEGIYLTYYDQAHTRGADIDQMDGAHAWITMDVGVSNDDYKQAIMRMRKMIDPQSKQRFSIALTPKAKEALEEKGVEEEGKITGNDVAFWLKSKELKEGSKELAFIVKKEFDSIAKFAIQQQAQKVEQMLFEEGRLEELSDFIESLNDNLMNWIEKAPKKLHEKYGGLSEFKDKESYLKKLNEQLEGQILTLFDKVEETIGTCSWKGDDLLLYREMGEQLSKKRKEDLPKEVHVPAFGNSTSTSEAQVQVQSQSESASQSQAQVQSHSFSSVQNEEAYIPPNLSWQENTYLPPNLNFLKDLTSCSEGKAHPHFQHLLADSVTTKCSPGFMREGAKSEDTAHMPLRYLLYAKTEEGPSILLIDPQEAELFQREGERIPYALYDLNNFVEDEGWEALTETTEENVSSIRDDPSIQKLRLASLKHKSLPTNLETLKTELKLIASSSDFDPQLKIDGERGIISMEQWGFGSSEAQKMDIHIKTIGNDTMCDVTYGPGNYQFSFPESLSTRLKNTLTKNIDMGEVQIPHDICREMLQEITQKVDDLKNEKILKTTQQQILEYKLEKTLKTDDLDENLAFESTFKKAKYFKGEEQEKISRELQEMNTLTEMLKGLHKEKESIVQKNQKELLKNFQVVSEKFLFDINPTEEFLLKKILGEDRSLEDFTELNPQIEADDLLEFIDLKQIFTALSTLLFLKVYKNIRGKLPQDLKGLKNEPGESERKALNNSLKVVGKEFAKTFGRDIAHEIISKSQENLNSVLRNLKDHHINKNFKKEKKISVHYGRIKCNKENFKDKLKDILEDLIKKQKDVDLSRKSYENNDIENISKVYQEEKFMLLQEQLKSLKEIVIKNQNMKTNEEIKQLKKQYQEELEKLGEGSNLLWKQFDVLNEEMEKIIEKQQENEEKLSQNQENYKNDYLNPLTQRLEEIERELPPLEEEKVSAEKIVKTEEEMADAFSGSKILVNEKQSQGILPGVINFSKLLETEETIDAAMQFTPPKMTNFLQDIDEQVFDRQGYDPIEEVRYGSIQEAEGIIAREAELIRGRALLTA